MTFRVAELIPGRFKTPTLCPEGCFLEAIGYCDVMLTLLKTVNLNSK